ncbi:hypothetical protein CCAX7_62920 [Capsulimonas corticalis]|uniref:Uncharacterized protein n=1 Tax=Capsulimonas corticalis TaxID=2219043 RepID=A0A402CWQ2_9BACT|nr:hypothetical protein [Capsulimonas corticalis]BDI34241.1 hypothetical protein CCAX7_62920 [Capsulimonas corticalis]
MTNDTTPLAPRIRLKIDHSWRFLRNDATGAEAPAFDDLEWRCVDLPHDYSMEDLPPGSAIQDHLRIDADGWRIHDGDNLAWSAEDLDESAWRQVEGRAMTGMPERSYAWVQPGP